MVSIRNVDTELLVEGGDSVVYTLMDWTIYWIDDTVDIIMQNQEMWAWWIRFSVEHRITLW